MISWTKFGGWRLSTKSHGDNLAAGMEYGEETSNQKKWREEPRYGQQRLPLTTLACARLSDCRDSCGGGRQLWRCMLQGLKLILEQCLWSASGRTLVALSPQRPLTSARLGGPFWPTCLTCVPIIATFTNEACPVGHGRTRSCTNKLKASWNWLRQCCSEDVTLWLESWKSGQMWAACVGHGGEVPVVAETDAASEDAFASLEVYCRILSPVWCEALASGEKMFEVQRYKQKKGGNVFKFAKAGDWVLFGAAGSEQVAGVAVLSGPAARKMKAREIEARAERLPEHLRAPFSEYMAEGVEFDMVEVQFVYDLRPLNLVWRQLSDLLQCKISRNIGFTKVRLQTPEAVQKLRSLVAKANVITRRAECDAWGME